MESTYIKTYLSNTAKIAGKIDHRPIGKIIKILLSIRKNCGRIFFLGVGGSSANASHAVNDFRKIGGFEAYAPTDNVSELTARTNDEGWSTVFASWLLGSKLCSKDCVFVLSVGGGNLEKGVSLNIIEALKCAQKKKAKIVGILGRDGGYTAKCANAAVIIPTVDENAITPHTEGFHGVVLHLIVSHPLIKINQTKWESLK